MDTVSRVYSRRISHYCLTARTKFRNFLPQTKQGGLGFVDALTLTADLAGVGGDVIFQAGVCFIELVRYGYHAALVVLSFWPFWVQSS